VHLRFYVGRDCHLCDIARGELERLRGELGFELEEVDITGDPELERRYRKWLPVVEADGEQISVFRVEEAELRARAHPEGR
jgi:glutaredoxin